MATLSRQPFAPLDGARLQTLTSIKNRQNAISNTPVKRKASDVVDVDDLENIDPVLFSKRAKGASGSDLTKGFFKPSTFILTKATSVSSLPPARDGFSVPSKPLSARPRTILQPKSPAAKRSSPKSAVPSPLTAPAGRSPPRASKRMGILSRRRTQRLDSLSFGSGATVPFSLDAALKGTIPSYSGSIRSNSSSNSSLDSLLPSDSKSSWFFDIHEDTPEQEMTNLLQHGTCTLDISSDEESERRAKRDRAEGRDKENIPPADDISQTSARSYVAVDADDLADMFVEKQRGPLAEMNVADYYAKGCDQTSIVIVPGDEEDAEAVVDEAEAAASVAETGAEAGPAHVEASSVDDIMRSSARTVLEPIAEAASESFEVWESSSAKDEAEHASQVPLPDDDEVPQAVPLVLW